MQEKKVQARPGKTVPLSEAAFDRNDGTDVYWLGAAGVLVNSRGTTIMIDPVLASGEDGRSEAYGKLLLVFPPVRGEDIRRLDAVLYTHADEDHLGLVTARALSASGAVYHTTVYAAGVLRRDGIAPERIREHVKQDVFEVGNIRIRMTGAFHPHQLGDPLRYEGWFYTSQDCTGYRLETEDGTLWIPGDTLLLEEHLENRDADLVFMDFGDNEHHFGRRLSVQLANYLLDSDLIMYHWGTFDAPEENSFNADANEVRPLLLRPERLHVLAPGERFRLCGRSGGRRQ